MTETRAPRFGQLEIPLTLIASDQSPILCSCINISSSGAFLSLLETDIQLYVGMSLHTKMLKKGKLTDVQLIIERMQVDGFGVRFVEQTLI